MATSAIFTGFPSQIYNTDKLVFGKDPSQGTPIAMGSGIVPIFGDTPGSVRWAGGMGCAGATGLTGIGGVSGIGGGVGGIGTTGCSTPVAAAAPISGMAGNAAPATVPDPPAYDAFWLFLAAFVLLMVVRKIRVRRTVVR